MLTPQLPIPRGKKAPPLCQEWETKTHEELEGLIQKYPDTNRGLRLDNYIHVDPDNEVAIKKVKQLQAEGVFPPTLTYQTWRGIACSLYQAHPEIFSSFDIKADGMALQIRTDRGHYAVIPDSEFKGKRYQWVQHLGPADIEVAPLPLDAVHHLKALASININNKHTTSKDPYGDFKLDFHQGNRDNSLFRVANLLIKGEASEAEAKQVLEILGQNCSPPFPLKELSCKIDSALRRQNQREKPIAEEVREWVLTSSGFFLTSDCFKDLGLTSRDFKKAATLEFLRLKDKGVIEPCGDKRGCYRLVDTTVEEIKWWEADTNIVPLVFPFDIHRLVNIYPKNIIIVAGATNAGKTALLLNIARLNRDRFKIHYFSNEMTKQELNKRLECFLNVGIEGDINEWRKVNFGHRDIKDFHQVIKPDDINIIDYIEITSDPWKVADQINDIHKRLDKGIAIIALQKKKGAEYAIGGHYSAFRSRLYLAMENNELKIVKGKNWAGNINPDGKTFRFKLVQGAKFVEQKY